MPRSHLYPAWVHKAQAWVSGLAASREVSNLLKSPPAGPSLSAAFPASPFPGSTGLPETKRSQSPSEI